MHTANTDGSPIALSLPGDRRNARQDPLAGNRITNERSGAVLATVSSWHGVVTRLQSFHVIRTLYTDPIASVTNWTRRRRGEIGPAWL